MSSEAEAFIYHQRTKHAFQRFARSAGYLDWSNQPDPFRRYAGAPLSLLPLTAESASASYSSFDVISGIPPAPVNAASIGAFFQFSLGISAWKELAGTRWELRCNPSSGNLHPTEGYLVCGAIRSFSETPGLYHYAPKEHGLECRACIPALYWEALRAGYPSSVFFVGLSSIHWREAWKYGERAYRYCQHDVGHALAALAYSGAALGWRVVLLSEPADAEIAALLGLDREADFVEAEAEYPDLLAAVVPTNHELPLPNGPESEAMLAAAANSEWQAQANRLSAEHLDWPAIETVSRACAKPRTALTPVLPLPPAPGATESSGPSARQIMLQRRSAQAMDGRTGIPKARFFEMLSRCLPRSVAAPWVSWPGQAQVHLLLFVHRVDGISPGLYFLIRDPAQTAELQAAMDTAFDWVPVPDAPPDLPLYLLREGDVRRLAARLSCDQDIAGESAFSLGMVTRFSGAILGEGPWIYPRLYWECGLIGQVLYLDAEAAGLRGTGIGCYFDDPVHQLLKLDDACYQSLYHFTVGAPLTDTRLRTLPPYPAARPAPMA
jgi:SagB-type dehydrogenase family enzyme